MKSHFLLWRESFYHSDIISSVKDIARVSDCFVCANDFNIFVTAKFEENGYYQIIESLKSAPGIRKVISFPVIREIVKGKYIKSKPSLIIAIRTPKSQNKHQIYDLIRNNVPCWADEVDGIFSYLVNFDFNDKHFISFLAKLNKIPSEYVEPLILVPNLNLL